MIAFAVEAFRWAGGAVVLLFATGALLGVVRARPEPQFDERHDRTTRRLS